MDKFMKALDFDSDTLGNVKRDMNFVLQRLIGNMMEKGSTNGSLTLKIDVSFTQEYIPNYDPKVEGESRKINKPSFKHKVTSTVQITDKKDGNMDTEMELAFDEDSGEYVLQPVANTTQKSIFDSDYKENLKPENEEESEKEEPKGIPQLPGPSEVEDEDVIDAEYTETEIGQETDEEPEEDITDEILGDAEGPDDMDGYDYEDPEDEVRESKRKGYALRNSPWADRIRERFMKRE